MTTFQLALSMSEEILPSGVVTLLATSTEEEAVEIIQQIQKDLILSDIERTELDWLCSLLPGRSSEVITVVPELDVCFGKDPYNAVYDQG